MSNYVQELLEGKIDFQGQSTVDFVSRLTLASATVLAFCLGFIAQDLRVTFGIMGVTVLGLALVVLPPWSMFNKHPVKWLSPTPKVQ